MFVIVGLGNPESKYAQNRHNVGYMAVDEIHRQNSGFSDWRSRFQAMASEGVLDGKKTLLVKPTTFMNNSGESVGAILRFFKLSAEDFLIIHDEIDLPPEKFRFKSGGGHGGHNGLRSISAHIGDGYDRLRLGVGHPGHKDLVYRYVLHDFSKSDRQWLDPLIEEIGRRADLLARRQHSQFANAMHRRHVPGGSGKRPATPQISGGRQPAKKAQKQDSAVKANTASGGDSQMGSFAAKLGSIFGWRKEGT